MKVDNPNDETSNSSPLSPRTPSILKKQKISTSRCDRLIVLCSAFLIAVFCIMDHLINKDIHIFSSLLLYPFCRIVDYYFVRSKPPED